MTLLEDIQASAVDGSSDLATVLRKCKLLAARLGSQPLEEWVLWESNGYPDNVPVPDYRTWPLLLKGHFSGAFGSGMRNAPIPAACIPKEVREKYTRWQCGLSIATIESTLLSSDGTIQVSTGDLALVLGMNVYRNQNCLQAWAEFSTANLVELLNTVRNRILDFVIAVWKEAPDAGELAKGTKTPMGAQRVTQIFNTTVYGGSANLVGTANSSSIEFNIGVADFQALKKVLAANGVGDKEISELEAALTAEPKAPSGESLGPRVSDWIAKMVGKAASGAWSIGIGAAGNLLATAIGHYYGFGQ